MKKTIAVVSACLLATALEAEVRISVLNSNAVALINYQCTAGETVRAFALDVSLDRGQIIGITNYFVGPSSAASRGYGIFPAAFRDHITVASGTNANWSVSGYTPLAVVADSPSDTLPGLGSTGVTLEFGALWDPSLPEAAPASSGTLCALQLSQGANVRVAANASRGGVVASPVGAIILPTFSGAFVGPPQITGAALVNGLVQITFEGGELVSASQVNGTWTGTGNTNGTYTESPATTQTKFFRVQRQ